MLLLFIKTFSFYPRSHCLSTVLNFIKPRQKRTKVHWIVPRPIVRCLSPHREKTVGCRRGWCERGDLNPHGITHQILSLARLPFRHSRKSRVAVSRRQIVT